jgi:protein SCO1/2
MIPRCLWSLAIPLILYGTASADSPPPDVGIDQRLGAQVPLELLFHDEHGRAVRLSDCTGGKPTVLVLAYYRCPMLCNQVLNGLLDALRAIPFDLGDQFHVVTVSFDPRERPVLAAAKKGRYVAEYGRPGADAGWRFLTGEPASITPLTEAVGFRYQYDAEHDQYAHASGIMLLTPEGKVSRYFYGIDYSPRDLRLGLVEASAGRIGSPVDRVLLLCYHYDPAVGKYTPAVMGFVRLGGALTLLGVVGLIGIALRRERRRALQSVPVKTFVRGNDDVC